MQRANSWLAEFKNIFFLFIPLLLTTFSTSSFLLIEKIFLARVSTPSLEAAITVFYVCQIFQSSCAALAMMSQVFVGRWNGAKEWTMIGPGIWQFIWFSFLSMFVTVPLTLLYGHFYFEGMAVKDIALPYFYFFVGMNFLYPLSMTLCSFFIGRKQTRLVVLATLFFQGIKIALAALFIFGYGTIFPSFGILGGALSFGLAQGGFCLFLLSIFLNKKHALLYQTRNFRFQKTLFFECIKPGFLRALNHLLILSCWAAVARLMTAKGGDYLLALSIGGSLGIFLSFLGEAVCQAQTTTVSLLIGSGQRPILGKVFWSGFFIVMMIIALISLPLVAFPLYTFKNLFPHIKADPFFVKNIFFGVWVVYSLTNIIFLPVSYVLAFKDTYFSLFMGFFSWVNVYFVMYLAVEKWGIEPAQFWLVLGVISNVITAVCYLLRMAWLNQKYAYRLT